MWLCVVRMWEVCGTTAVVCASLLRGWKVLMGSLTEKIQPLRMCQAAEHAKMRVQFPYALVGFRILGLI